VAQYELISRNVLPDDDFGSPQIKAEVEGLLKMYEMRGSMADRVGTVVAPAVSPWPGRRGGPARRS